MFPSDLQKTKQPADSMQPVSMINAEKSQREIAKFNSSGKQFKSENINNEEFENKINEKLRGMDRYVV